MVMGSEESTRSALSQVSRVKLVLGDANGWNAVGSRRRYAPLAFANRALSEQGLENGFLKQSTVGTSKRIDNPLSISGDPYRGETNSDRGVPPNLEGPRSMVMMSAVDGACPACPACVPSKLPILNVLGITRRSPRYP